MKILHLTNVYAPAGGIETYVIDLLPLLEAAGHQNALIYREQHPRTPPLNGRPIFHVPNTRTPDSDRQRILSLAREQSPDVIYLHDVYDPELIQQITRVAPTVGYVHIFYPVCPGLGKLFHKTDQICTRPFGAGCVANIYLKNCASARNPKSVYRIMQATRQYLVGYQSLSKVIVASRYMQDLMLQNGIGADKLAVLPYFIPIPPRTAISPVDANCRDIFFAGRLDYEKGVPYLLRALQLIPEPHRLLIAGDGSQKTDYMRLAKDLGVAHRVEFMGWLSANELDAAYRQCAVTVMPTIMAEPFGKVGVEAMANNRPVVAFDVGGISDWLKDGYNGFLVPPLNVPQLAAKLNQILPDLTLAATLGINGRKYVEENYTTAQHLDGLIKILQQAVHGEAHYVY